MDLGQSEVAKKYHNYHDFKCWRTDNWNFGQGVDLEQLQEPQVVVQF
jgi:hypothetical protein